MSISQGQFPLTLNLPVQFGQGLPTNCFLIEQAEGAQGLSSLGILSVQNNFG